MANSSFDKYEVTQFPTSASQIISGSFSDTLNGGTLTINYLNVGKLYFGFWTTFGGKSFVLGSNNGTIMTACFTELATKLGVTVNTTYSGQNNTGAVGNAYWDTVNSWWDQSNNASDNTFIVGFLAN